MSDNGQRTARADRVSTEGTVASESEHSALRADIRRLSTLLGRTVAAQHGDDMLELVEKVRRLVRVPSQSRRSSGDTEIRDLLGELDPGTAAVLGRAFATYFHLANLAEQLHRARGARRRAREGRGPLHEVLADRLVADADPDELSTALSRLELKPVFTAHPTEAQRQSVLGKLRAIADVLARRPARRAWPRPGCTVSSTSSGRPTRSAPSVRRCSTRRARWPTTSTSSDAAPCPRCSPSSTSSSPAWACTCPRARARSCWAAGSAATATATPTSPPS